MIKLSFVLSFIGLMNLTGVVAFAVGETESQEALKQIEAQRTINKFNSFCENYSNTCSLVIDEIETALSISSPVIARTTDTTVVQNFKNYCSSQPRRCHWVLQAAKRDFLSDTRICLPGRCP